MGTRELYPRGKSGVIWIRFTAPDGRRIHESTRTTDERQALEYRDRRKAELWRVGQLKERPRKRWQDAALRWLEERAGKRSINKDRENLKWLDPHLRDVRLDEITRDVIDRIARARRKGGAAPATVNRTLALLRSILRAAVEEWEWLTVAPRVKLTRESTEAWRWLTRDEASRLVKALPPHLARVARFALATGLREQNILGLKWDSVDLERRMAWVLGSETKAGKALAVPLNAEAVIVLREAAELRVEGVPFCFTFRNGKKPGKGTTGRVARANNTAWRSAVLTAGVAPLRFHDLRHTWASWHVQDGTPLNVLQELGGWATLSMVQRYAHLSAAHLSEHAERISAPRLVAAPNLHQAPGATEKVA